MLGNSLLRDFILSFTAVFVALDIIGIVPLYIGLTRSMSPANRKVVLDKSIGVAFSVAVLFAILGHSIFGFLSINEADFKMAGGLVLLLVSLADLLQGPESQQHSSGSTGIVPLAVPLISGPAVITTAILQVSARGYVITVVSLVVNFLMAWWVLSRSESVARLIGKDGTVVISKIAALMMAAIAVSMIRGGLEETVRAYLPQ